MKRFIENLDRLGLGHCKDHMRELVDSLDRRLTLSYGNEKKWRDLFNQLPDIVPSGHDLTLDRIHIGQARDTDDTTSRVLYETLKAMTPWRKGPFDVFGINVDSEWASNIKWNRLKDHIEPLKDRKVLDIGCSSGYYMFKMLEYGPRMVLGIDPQILFYYQFKAMQKYLQSDRLFYLPAKLEDLPPLPGYFDSVFFMGVIYHRKSPVDSLNEIRESMRTGGELILETLIIEDDGPVALFPMDRYAKMRNVFFIPSVPCLEGWLSRARFEDIRCLDISRTTAREQRKTDWIKTESLEDFLDPLDPLKTVEGYPAPVRAIVTAKAKL